MYKEFDEEDVMQLLFDPKINRFVDEFGAIIHDIFRYITPNQLVIFKKFKHQYLIPDITNSCLIELIYPDEEDKDE